MDRPIVAQSSFLEAILSRETGWRLHQPERQGFQTTTRASGIHNPDTQLQSSSRILTHKTQKKTTTIEAAGFTIRKDDMGTHHESTRDPREPRTHHENHENHEEPHQITYKPAISTD
jgi:hypothetical protein